MVEIVISNGFLLSTILQQILIIYTCIYTDKQLQIIELSLNP